LNLLLMVPSAEYCVASIFRAGSEKCSVNFRRRSLLRLVIASNEWACFCHNHSYTCLARNFCWPSSWKYDSRSCKVNSLIFFFAVFNTAAKVHFQGTRHKGQGTRKTQLTRSKGKALSTVICHLSSVVRGLWSVP